MEEGVRANRAIMPIPAKRSLTAGFDPAIRNVGHRQLDAGVFAGARGKHEAPAK